MISLTQTFVCSVPDQEQGLYTLDSKRKKIGFGDKYGVPAVRNQGVVTYKK